jgi:electron transport complex protein RnfB
MIAATLVIVSIVAVISISLVFASARLRSNRDDVVERVNALLPQTQCGQCGFAGCRPYAEAIVTGAATINQCAPGGEATIIAIGHLLDRRPVPPDPAFGVPKAAQVAVIAENICIGCGLCLRECPVDSILGAPHYMHTVIASECTGCELCVAPCPVDCITMETE